MYTDGTFITKYNDRVRQNEPISHVLLCYHFLWRFSYEKRLFLGAHDKWKGVSLILILFKCSTSFFWTTVYALFHGVLFHFFCKFFSVVLYHKSCSLGTQETSWRKYNKISPIYCAWKRPTFSLSHICTTFHFQNKMSCLLSTWVMMKSLTKRT